MTDNNHPIYELVRILEDAWNSGNSRRFVSVFAEDADFINIYAKHFNGRESVDAGHREIFDTVYRNSRNCLTIEGVRFVRPDAVVVFIHATLELADGRVIHSRPSLLLTKDNAQWQVAVFQNTAVSEPKFSPMAFGQSFTGLDQRP